MNLVNVAVSSKGAVLTFDDSSTQEFDYAVVQTTPQSVTLTSGQSVEVIAQ